MSPDPHRGSRPRRSYLQPLLINSAVNTNTLPKTSATGLPVMVVSITKLFLEVGTSDIYSFMSFSLIRTLCTVLPENFMIQQPSRLDCQLLFGKEPRLEREMEIDPNIFETLSSVLGKNSSCLTFTSGKFSIYRFFRTIFQSVKPKIVSPFTFCLKFPHSQVRKLIHKGPFGGSR